MVMINYKNRIYGITKEIDTQELEMLFQKPEAWFIEVALLFGSRVTGTAHSRSDYDFALFMNQSADEGWGLKAKAYTLLSDLLGLDDCDIDIVDLKMADKVILDSIKEGFIILKGNKDDISRLLG